MQVNKREAYKLSLFNKYSQNLELVTGYKDLYVCPLCTKGYQRADIEFLTIEHIIPEKLGGKLKILTCKKCNNEYGTKLISKLTKYFSYEDINLGKNSGPLDGYFISDGRKVKAGIFLDPERITFNIQNHRSDPKNTSYILSKIESGKIDEFTMEAVIGVNQKYIRLAISLISYYLLFSYLGYFYVYNSSGEYLRKIILDLNYDHPLTNHMNMSEFQYKSENPLVWLCTQPIDIKNFVLVQIPFITAYNTYVFGKLLPILPGVSINTDFFKEDLKIQVKCQLFNYSEELKNQVWTPRR